MVEYLAHHWLRLRFDANSTPIRHVRHSLRWILIAATAQILCACTTFRTLEKCGFSGCPGDAQTTAHIEAAIREHAALSAWDIEVQTLDHVVYLYGLVDTDPQRTMVESLAMEEPGVSRVVNSISVRNVYR